MEIKEITSENNKIIKQIKSLELKKQRIKQKQFLIEGLRIVDECIKYSGDIEYIVYSEKLHKIQGGDELLEKISTKGYSIYKIPNQLFEKLTTTETPQGLMAVVNMKNITLKEIETRYNKDLFFVILDRIQDPGNMGTIIRTAESAKVDAIIITKGSVDPYNSKTLRATMGAVFHLPIIQCNDDQWMEYLKEKDVRLIAADLNTDEIYTDINYSKNIGIVIGNEANGISNKILSKVDEKVIIPILGKIESLNASVAAGILIYKAVEERFLK